MKKTIGILMFVFLLFSVSAITDNETNLTNPGTTPDSALYFLDLAMENLGLALTIDNDARIEKELEMAEERLSEAKEMALENNLEDMAKAEEKNDKILTKLKSELGNVNANNSTEELKKQLKIEQKINAHDVKVKNVKNELKLKIEVSGNLTNEQQQLLDSLIASFENKAGEVEIEINNEKGATKLKITNETGEDGEDIEDDLREELEIEDDNEIEIEVEKGIAKVKVEINDIKQEFELKIDSNQSEYQIREQVMNEIANKYSISVQEVKKIKGEFEIEDEENEDEEDEDEEDEEKGISDSVNGQEDEEDEEKGTSNSSDYRGSQEDEEDEEKRTSNSSDYQGSQDSKSDDE
jgi:hypothetical protein